MRRAVPTRGGGQVKGAHMTNASNPRLEPLRLENIDEIAAFWRCASPLHPAGAAMLRERLFESPGADPELLLGARDATGRLLGIVSGVLILEHQRFAGVRWLALEPTLDPAAREGRAVAGALLDELCASLAARGVEKVRMLGTPPYYFRPGVDTRETGLIACLLELGWTHEATHFNMSVDLGRWGWAAPGEDAIFGTDACGYRVRRARPEDREAFIAYMNQAWTASWRDESLQAFKHDPITLFLAVKAGENNARDLSALRAPHSALEKIVGFAAYEVSQCLGGFGPTGVSTEHRGAALGRRVLWACLHALHEAGRPVCEIGWVGPVPFYHRACGAVLGPTYWFMTKAVK